MFRKYRKGMVVIVFFFIIALVGAGPAAAQAPQGGGPDEAMVPTGAWTEIKSGEYHWYKFHFDYDADRVAKPVEIRMYAEPYDGAILTVRNEEQAQLWRTEGEQEHFGCCTMVDVDRNDDGKSDYAVWAGTLRSSGDYYIVVEHAKSMTQPAMYRFTVSGEGLSFPMAKPAPAAAPAKAAEPTKVEPRMMTGLEGTGPDYAMVPNGEWTAIDEGAYHWYAFYFDYDADRMAEPIEIRLYTDRFDGATLTVRNAEQAQLWRDEGEHQHFGCCTMVDVDKDKDGNADYAVWAGTLRSSGTYYIVVEHARNMTGPVMYRFTMSGKGFSFPSMAAKPVAPPAAAAPAAPEPIKPIVLTGLNGTGPDYALAPTTDWVAIEDGQYHWYAFQFDYDEDKDMKAVEIRFYADPYEGATLTVRNEEQANLWRQDGKHEHFGCCTLVDADKDKDGRADYALWASNLRASGTYYIVVEHTKNMSGPVMYRFELTGDGISH
jgi:5-hydroxyisourate hydrolase-like protein (transthyretin family)